MIDDLPKDLFPFPLSDDARWIRRRELFYERALGPMEQPGVYHFEDSSDPHVDVYLFGPNGSRTHEIFLTGGLSDRVQPGIPPGGTEPRRLELLTRVESGRDWAALILREIATLPFLFFEPLAAGQLIHGSRSIRSDSVLRHAILDEVEEPALEGFLVEGEETAFLGVQFISTEEYLHGTRHGGAALLARLRQAGVGPVANPSRASIF